MARKYCKTDIFKICYFLSRIHYMLPTEYRVTQKSSQQPGSDVITKDHLKHPFSSSSKIIHLAILQQYSGPAIFMFNEVVSCSGNRKSCESDSNANSSTYISVNLDKSLNLSESPFLFHEIIVGLRKIKHLKYSTLNVITFFSHDEILYKSLDNSGYN